jgi:hypothetical protein
MLVVVRVALVVDEIVGEMELVVVVEVEEDDNVVSMIENWSDWAKMESRSLGLETRLTRYPAPAVGHPLTGDSTSADRSVLSTRGRRTSSFGKRVRF